jgi:hypothetical protein
MTTKTNKYYMIVLIGILLISGTLLYLINKHSEHCPKEPSPDIAPIPEVIPEEEPPRQVFPPTPEEWKRIEEISIPLEKNEMSSNCAKYERIGKSLLNTRAISLCYRNDVYLIVFNSELSAKDIYKRWVKKAKRLNHNLKKEHVFLSVHVVDNNVVSKSHYCTVFKNH